MKDKDQLKYFGCNGRSTKEAREEIRNLRRGGKIDYKRGSECKSSLKIGFKEEPESTAKSSNPETNPDSSGSDSRIPRDRFSSVSLFVLIIITIFFINDF